MFKVLGVFMTSSNGVSTLAVCPLQCYRMNSSELNSLRGSSVHALPWFRNLNVSLLNEEQSFPPGIVSSGKELTLQPNEGLSADVFVPRGRAACFLCPHLRGPPLCYCFLPAVILEFVFLEGRDLARHLCVNNENLRHDYTQCHVPLFFKIKSNLLILRPSPSVGEYLSVGTVQSSLVIPGCSACHGVRFPICSMNAQYNVTCKALEDPLHI